MANRSLSTAERPLELLEGTAEARPLDDGSIDTVMSTWTLCSIPEVERALADMHRVLRPDGKLLFVEHGQAPEPTVRRWQHRLNPAWRRLAGGCNLDRPIDALIAGAGFRIELLNKRVYGRSEAAHVPLRGMCAASVNSVRKRLVISGVAGRLHAQ
jgi:SAM-dependent methyltransferase